MKQNNINWPSFVSGILAGMFLVYVLTSGYIRIQRSDLGDSLPNNLSAKQASELLVKRFRDVDRLDREIRSYTRNTRISKSLQDQIAGNLGPSISAGDTFKGITFDLEPIMKSLISANPGDSSLSSIKIKDRSIYVAFGRYPDSMPGEFKKSIDSVVYNRDFKNKPTGFINYLIRNKGNYELKYEFISDPSDKEVIGDNLGNKCKPYCPGGQ